MRMMLIAAAAAATIVAVPASAQSYRGDGGRGWSHQDRYDHGDRYDRYDRVDRWHGEGRRYDGYRPRAWHGPRRGPVIVDVLPEAYPVYEEPAERTVVVEKHVYVHHVVDRQVTYRVAHKAVHRKPFHRTAGHKAKCSCK